MTRTRSVGRSCVAIGWTCTSGKRAVILHFKSRGSAFFPSTLSMAAAAPVPAANSSVGVMNPGTICRVYPFKYWRTLVYRHARHPRDIPRGFSQLRIFLCGFVEREKSLKKKNASSVITIAKLDRQSVSVDSEGRLIARLSFHLHIGITLTNRLIIKALQRLQTMRD